MSSKSDIPPGPGAADAPQPRGAEAVVSTPVAARRFELVTRAAGIGYWSLEDGAERAEWGEPLRVAHGLAPGQQVPNFDDWIAHHVHEADRAATRRNFAVWAQAGYPDSLAQSLRIVRPGGEVRHLITQTLREAGPPAALFGVVVDVTERVRAEEALLGARERVALATRGAGMGTWELDLDSGASVWDEQMWLLRGRTPRAKAMDADERLACVHPDDRERVARLIDAGAQGDQLLEYEFRVLWPDGQVRWLASRSSVSRDAATGRRQRIGVNWDVTEARSAVEARRESLAKSAFLARMSHELRTPLNAVLGFAQLLLAEDSGADEAALRRRRHLEHIRGAGQHLLELINDALDLARAQGGELRVERVPVDLTALVTDAASLMERGAAERRIAMRIAIAPDAPPTRALADPTRLRQVLLNLLSNAIKYNHDGGRVEVRVASQAGEVSIEVEDTGRGFDAHQQLQLFEPFNRLGRDHEPIEGTGIGLAIVKALVERMGGRVEAEGRPGAGSVFRVWLAAAGHAAADVPPSRAVVSAPAPRPALAPGAEPPAPAARQRLLYIEDNPVNALIIRELIAMRPDIELRVEGTGCAGIAAAAAWQPRLVLLDMQLPDLDGFEVLRRLRSAPASHAIPVVALSANAMPADIRRALDAGLADYWTKPLDVGVFLQRLGHWFGPGAR